MPMYVFSHYSSMNMSTARCQEATKEASPGEDWQVWQDFLLGIASCHGALLRGIVNNYKYLLIISCSFYTLELKLIHTMYVS